MRDNIGWRMRHVMPAAPPFIEGVRRQRSAWMKQATGSSDPIVRRWFQAVPGSFHLIL